MSRCSIDEGGGSGCQYCGDWVNSRHMERSGRAPQDPSVCSGQPATPHWKKINPIIPQTHTPLPLCSSLVFFTSVLSTHTQNLYKMLLLGCSLLSLHSSPYLLPSFLKATWLALWTEYVCVCVFMHCMRMSFCPRSFSLMRSVLNLNSAKVEFSSIHRAWRKTWAGLSATEWRRNQKVSGCKKCL